MTEETKVKSPVITGLKLIETGLGIMIEKLDRFDDDELRESIGFMDALVNDGDTKALKRITLLFVMKIVNGILSRRKLMKAGESE